MSGAVERAADLATLAYRGPLSEEDLGRLAEAAAADPDPRVRATALGALVRGGAPEATALVVRAFADGVAAVRRRAAELAPLVATPDAMAGPLVAALGDRDVTVVEAVCFALGELGGAGHRGVAVERLVSVVTDHPDPLAREAAVAALGALGDPRGLPAILAACRDKPAVRRRAVLALAPFSGPDVDAALAAALADRDWQVRQAAEDLT